MKNLISVVLPAYNAEKTIRQAIESVLKDADVELVIINDGSTDSTEEIIKEYADDKRLKYLKQSNAGVSAARNAGLKAASGNYIAFLDSDDYFKDGALERIYELIEKYNCDLIGFGFYLENIIKDKVVSTSANSVSRIIETKASSADDYLKYIFSSSKIMGQISPNKVFRKDIIDKNNILFDSEMVAYENLTFIFKFMQHCGNIVFSPDILYYYNMRTDDLPKQALEKRKKDILTDDVSKCFRQFIKLTDMYGYSDDCKSYMYQMFFEDYTYCSKKFFMLKDKYSFSERKKMFSEFLNDKEFLYLKNNHFGWLKFYRIIYKLDSMKLSGIAYFLYRKRVFVK